ncbi:protein DWARF 53-like [Phragmites australis]|uniref:protein DWARF 53-like n=1 Tax=Phragmites australis TaxID=29695 RepID=UPI002D793284|nr:protein DWARF 53-like [Phragmites australis]
MPTPVPAARQCLSPAAVTALDAAVVSARRRAHAQTTSLHLISSLLAPAAPPLLRDALARARSAAYSPRLQLKALELCFAVSLDRLPSSSASSSNDDPPVSNSLMAAIKRSQANQRRNPDTFHFYHQTQAQSPSAVKVDLSHLVLAILDDPLVSRVFADAGFRSGDIKLAILRPAPPMPLLGRLPTRARPPPLFLCSFAAADDADVPSPAGSLAGAGAGEENCRRIAEILSRGRNPMLVGVGAASAAADFAAASPYRILPVGPTSINQMEIGVAAATTTSPGLIISIGDLKDLVPDEADLQERGRQVVAEVTRVLETHRAGRVWVMGWSATYETYLTFLSKFPLLDKDWELQLLPITDVRPAGTTVMPPATTVAALSRPPATASTSLMESFAPFGGFLCDTYEANSLAANSCPQALRCQQCNDRYEQEVATIIRGSGITAEAHQEGLPSLLQNGSMMVGPNNGFDAVKVRDDQVLNSKFLNLQKKWNEYCLRLHQSCQRINRDPYQLFPHYIGVPVDRERTANPSKGSGAVAPQKEVVKPSAVSASLTNTAAKSNSSPSISNQRNEDLVLKLQVRQSKSDEHLQDRGVQSQHRNSPNCDHEDHVSPSSAAPVATDLVLGTACESSSKDSSASQCKHVEDTEGSIHLMPKKVDDLNLKPPQLFVQPYSCSRSSSNWGQMSPSALHSAASGGTSAFGQWQRPSPLAAQSFDLRNYKQLVEHLFKAVGRQEEALSAICESIVRCRSMERCRGANKKNDIWFSFHGPDSIAKRRVATVLAELMHGSKENLIYLDLRLQDSGDSNFRGNIGTDCLVEELSKKRRSIIFLDNIDKADCLVLDSLSYAIENGKFKDWRGKMVDINSIVVLSSRMIQGCRNASLGVEEGHAFSEEKALTARGHQLKILVESGATNISGGPGGKVAVSTKHSLSNIQASLYTGSVSKRKLNISDVQEKLQESSSNSKRLHRASSVPFDLNLPVDEAEPHDDSSSSSHDNSSSNPDGSVENLLRSVDESINFKPFDFGKLAEDMLQEFSNVLCSILGSECRLEIDVGAMEQILAAAWSSDSEDRRPVRTWLEQVFARSLVQLKLKCKHVSSSTLRLVACEDTAAKDERFGGLLPSRIILD